MRFLLKLVTPLNTQKLPLNYQYPLSADIYKIIERADGLISFLYMSKIYSIYT